jgi:hypothetical protein
MIVSGACRKPYHGINFVIAHDGFTLHDLVSYNDKHNDANGESNRDGTNDNFSWNCGAEGPTDDEAVLALRQRQMRNLMLALLVSQGTPMVLSGDPSPPCRPPPPTPPPPPPTPPPHPPTPPHPPPPHIPISLVLPHPQFHAGMSVEHPSCWPNSSLWAPLTSQPRSPLPSAISRWHFSIPNVSKPSPCFPPRLTPWLTMLALLASREPPSCFLLTPTTRPSYHQLSILTPACLTPPNLPVWLVRLSCTRHT